MSGHLGPRRGGSYDPFSYSSGPRFRPAAKTFATQERVSTPGRLAEVCPPGGREKIAVV